VLLKVEVLGFGLVGVGGCLIMVVSVVSWLGSFWGKFWVLNSGQWWIFMVISG
jgi:hypothetical protein